jgi:3-oxoacyl-[acyl-carrier protein] reductase
MKEESNPFGGASRGRLEVRDFCTRDLDPVTSLSFSDRVVLVTGASRGLGRATATRFLELGATVAVNVRTKERAAELARELGAGAVPAAADLSSGDAIRSMIADTVERFGRLDVLVNNAAVAFPTKIDAIPEQEWRETLNVNLTAAFLCLQAAIPSMRERGYGRVINVSSTAGRSVSTLAGAHYSASKAGLLGLTRAAAKELGPHGITVNAVCPGMFDTELMHTNATDERIETLKAGFPARRLGRPPELAELICFVASEHAGYINGASIDINGGALLL